MGNKQNTNYVYVVVILILIAILFSILFRAYGNYSAYKEHKTYFNQPNPQIQGWMSIKTIFNNFNLSSQEIFKETGVNETKINIHMSLNRFCREYRQNCTLLIEKLNNRVGI